MAKIILTPMLGTLSQVRTESLRSCHALIEHSRTTAFLPGDLGGAFERVFKQFATDDYIRERLLHGEEINLVVTLKL